MSIYVKISSYIIAVYLSYKLNVYLKNRFKEYRNNGRTNGDKQMVLFFPDKQMDPKDCYRLQSDQLIANNPNSDLCQLLSVLKSSQSSLDVCMYCLSFEPIIQLIQDLSQNKGIVVRIVINGQNRQHVSEEHQEVSKREDRLRKLFNFGVELKYLFVANEGLMHNKFALIDNCLLINGSLNWTANAIFYSYNDCIVTTDPKLVLSYSREFNNFWSIV